MDWQQATCLARTCAQQPQRQSDGPLGQLSTGSWCSHEINCPPPFRVSPVRLATVWRSAAVQELPSSRVAAPTQSVSRTLRVLQQIARSSCRFSNTALLSHLGQPARLGTFQFPRWMNPDRVRQAVPPRHPARTCPASPATSGNPCANTGMRPDRRDSAALKYLSSYRHPFPAQRCTTSMPRSRSCGTAPWHGPRRRSRFSPWHDGRVRRRSCRGQHSGMQSRH